MFRVPLEFLFLYIEKGQSNNPLSSYTEKPKSQQEYNTQVSKVQYTKGNTQPEDQNTYIHGNQETSVQVCSYNSFCKNKYKL